MSQTLAPENIAQPYAQRSKEGVLWWVLTVASFLLTVGSDIATLALVWWFTQNGTSIERLQDVEDAKVALILTAGLFVGTFGLRHVLRVLTRRVTDAIPGATGVVIVDKLPGLQAPGFFIRILPHTVWMATILMVGKYALDFSPAMLCFVLLAYYLYALRSLGRACTYLTVARNKFGVAALVLAGALVGFGFPILGTLTAEQIAVILVLVITILMIDFMLRGLRWRPSELGMTYRLSPVAGVAREVRRPVL